ncbi:MAG: class I adenylate-forming enzyme family protein [Chloroflexi bacterium]|nr:class I adenylate-forming enzyme family protein [Chloroflexota bacterium]
MIPIRYSKEQFEKLSKEGFWSTTVDYFEENARKYPNDEALVDSINRLTFAQVKDKSDKLAAGFIDMGFKKDQILVLQIPNVTEYFIIRCALAKAGLIGLFTMMYLRHKEIEFACNQSKAVGIIICPIFHDYNYCQLIKEVQPNLPHLKHVFVIGNEIPSGTISISEMMNRTGKVNTKDFIKTKLRPGEIDEVKVTSGTTGTPKLTESFRIASQETIAELVRRFKVEHKDIFAALAPLTGGASGGPICKGIALAQGCKIVLLERFETEEALKLLEQEKVTFATGVPTMMAKIIRHPDFSKYNLKSIRAFHSSGTYLPPGLAKEVEEKIGCRIVNHYGAIDVGVASSTSFNPLEVRLSSVGKPVPDVLLKLLDDNGKDVPQGEVGEIVWSSPRGGTFAYFRDLESTLKREASGFTRSGDLGKLDDSGNLYIVGRKKDMIIRGGQNIFPAEIESILITHPKILNIAVVSMPDQLMGEKACAFVILRSGQNTNCQKDLKLSIVSQCREMDRRLSNVNLLIQ